MTRQERIMRLLKVYFQRKVLINRLEDIGATAYKQGDENYAERVFNTRLKLVYQSWDNKSVLEFYYKVLPFERHY